MPEAAAVLPSQAERKRKDRGRMQMEASVEENLSSHAHGQSSHHAHGHLKKAWANHTERGLHQAADDSDSSAGDRHGLQVDAQRGVGDATWLDRPFHEYTAQCSHNTYLKGRQSRKVPSLTGCSEPVDSTDEATMAMALSLGYRCIEIDVWPWSGDKNTLYKDAFRRQVKVSNCGHVPFGTDFYRGPAGQPQLTETEEVLLEVVHKEKSVGALTNARDLALFLKAILEWCVQDERTVPGTDAAPKMPVTISIENHLSKRKKDDTDAAAQLRQNQMAKIFGFLGDDRIIKPGEFAPGTKMSTLVSKAPDHKRRFILKTKPSPYDLEAIVAMKGEGTSTYISK